ncbi:MAG TPA: hypothetical protein VEK84_18090 [Terriglobales bacterium]|nr:hypothetical protein [Terriglobales bacterium]
MNDLKFAIRQLLKNPGFTAVAVLTLAAFKALAHAQVLGGKCWTVPVFANGWFYARNLQRALICLEMKGAK